MQKAGNTVGYNPNSSYETLKILSKLMLLQIREIFQFSSGPKKRSTRWISPA